MLYIQTYIPNRDFISIIVKIFKGSKLFKVGRSPKVSRVEKGWKDSFR